MELKGGTRFAKETDEIYRQFAEAMKTGDADLKEEALRRLAESNKAVWHFENMRYYLLQLADTFDGIPELIEATDREYGVGVTGYIAKAIREHYGVSWLLDVQNAFLAAFGSRKRMSDAEIEDLKKIIDGFRR